MCEVNRLVATMVQFLGEQLRNDTMSVDAKESIEVAIQCLESAYNVSSSDAHLLPSRTLMEIFTEATKGESFAKEGTPTEESKREADSLKAEGNDLMKLERFEDALKCYTKAIQLDSKNAVFYCNRAAAYSKLSNHTFALEDCHRAIEIDSNYSKAYGRMGLAYASLNDHYRAKECYQKAVELEPGNESYQNNLKIAEEKITDTLRQDPLGALGGGAGGVPGMGPGGFDMGAVLTNPNLMNMASQLMQDPQMQNLIGGLLTGSGGVPGGRAPPAAAAGEPQSQTVPPMGDGQSTDAAPAAGGGFQAFLQAGQQLAAQMEQNNPDLVDQIRRQIGRGGAPGGPPDTDGNAGN